MTSKKKQTDTQHTDDTLAARAEHARKEILRMEADFAEEEGLDAAARRQGALAMRVTLEGLAQSIGIAEKYGPRAGDFDTALVKDAVEYERAMGPLLNTARSFVRHVEDGILRRHQKAGTQVLALMASLLALKRYKNREEVQQDVDTIRSLVKHPKRSRKAKAKPKGEAAPSTTPPPEPVHPAPAPAEAPVTPS